MALIKKLTKIGNSYGIILPTEVLKIAGMVPEGDCEIEVDGEGVLLKPHFKTTKTDQKIMESMARFIRKYRQDLKKLAE